MKLETAVGASLLIFAYLFSGIVLFGMVDTSPAGTTTLLLFKIAFFALTLIILGIIYLANKHNLKTALEHVVIILLITLLSFSFAESAGNLKSAYDLSTSAPIITLQKDMVALDAQNTYYAGYLSGLSNQTRVLHSNNLILLDQIQKLNVELVSLQKGAPNSVQTPPPQQPQTPQPPSSNNRYYDDDSEVNDD